MKLYSKYPAALTGVLLSFACLLSACSAPAGDSGASDAGAVPSGGTTSREESASPESGAEPVAAGFVTLTRDQYSTLGCGTEQGYYEVLYG